jgi:hypothetical protein
MSAYLRENKRESLASFFFFFLRYDIRQSGGRNTGAGEQVVMAAGDVRHLETRDLHVMEGRRVGARVGSEGLEPELTYT